MQISFAKAYKVSEVPLPYHKGLIYNATMATIKAPIAPTKDPLRTEAELAVTDEGLVPVEEVLGLGAATVDPLPDAEPPDEEPLPDEDPLLDPVAAAADEPVDEAPGIPPNMLEGTRPPLVAAAVDEAEPELEPVADAEPALDDLVAEDDAELDPDDDDDAADSETPEQERSKAGVDKSSPTRPKLGLAVAVESISLRVYHQVFTFPKAGHPTSS